MRPLYPQKPLLKRKSLALVKMLRAKKENKMMKYHHENEFRQRMNYLLSQKEGLNDDNINLKKY